MRSHGGEEMVGKIKAMAALRTYVIVCTSFFMAARGWHLPPCKRKLVESRDFHAANWNPDAVVPLRTTYLRRAA